ncbi:MAG: hypothetical protein Q8R31_00835 [Candidatus Omnitrophota bacterium]|nr:hypothetical protein [Candidatus Omnitrophota bacterium]
MRDFDVIIRVPFMFVTCCFVLAVFLGIIIWFWLKGDSNTIRKMPIAFATAQFILIVIFSIIVLVWTKYNEEAGVAWRVFYFLDWPVSLLIRSETIWRIWTPIFKLPLIKTIPDAITGNVVFPFINFGILGTAQYYIWGLIISKALLFLRR